MLRTALFWTLLLGTFATLVLIVWTHFSIQDTEPSAKLATRNVSTVRSVPPEALQAYQRAAGEGVRWQFLAALGSAESDHGRSLLPGVRSGINSAGCCAGPMQLCVEDSCGNVASLYARDGDGDGTFSVYDIDDAAATAAAYIRWMHGSVGTNEKRLAAAYNAGPTLVSRKGIPSYPETRDYLEKTSRFLRQLGEE